MRALLTEALQKCIATYPLKQKQKLSIAYSIKFCVGFSELYMYGKIFSLYKGTLHSLHKSCGFNGIFTMLSTQLLRYKQQRALCVCISHLRNCI